MSPKQWVFDPDSGGVKIKENIKRRTEERIIRYAESNLAGRYTMLNIRFWSQFCYVDAYTEPEVLTMIGRHLIFPKLLNSISND